MKQHFNDIPYIDIIDVINVRDIIEMLLHKNDNRKLKVISLFRDNILDDLLYESHCYYNKCQEGVYRNVQFP